MTWLALLYVLVICLEDLAKHQDLNGPAVRGAAPALALWPCTLCVRLPADTATEQLAQHLFVFFIPRSWLALQELACCT